MKEMNLEDLSRYAFSGGWFLIVLLLQHPKWLDRSPSAIGGVTAVIAAALLVGTLIYALHRALAYRFIFTVAALILVLFRVYRFERALVTPLVPSRAEVGIDDWRVRLLWWIQDHQNHQAEQLPLDLAD